VTGTTSIIARRDAAADTAILNVTNNPNTLTVAPKPMAIKSVSDTLARRPSRSTPRAIRSRVPRSTGAPSTRPSRRRRGGTRHRRRRGQHPDRGTTAIAGATDQLTVKVTNDAAIVSIIPTNATLASINDTLANFPVNFRNSKGVVLPRTAVIWKSEDRASPR